MAGADLTEALAEQIRAAVADGRPLRPVGGDTRRFYGRPVEAEALPLAGHSGIVDYDPAELVITARAGTLLSEIEARLAEHGQMLAFEPPGFGAASTIGGTVAGGLSGPRRPFAGSLRDAVLGVRVIDGRGRPLRFGGTVFKNVAGFDAFRLMAGSLGCLALITEVSLRIGPRPRAETSLALELALPAAAALVGDLTTQPLSGAVHDGERLHLRLSGGAAAVEAAALQIGGEREPGAFWDRLRNLTHPFFQGDAPLWRLSISPAVPQPTIEGRWLWDWAGAQRWLVTDAAPDAVWAAVSAAGGHAARFRGAPPDGEVFQPLPAPLMALQRRVKAALDPDGVFNPGRMYAGL